VLVKIVTVVRVATAARIIERIVGSPAVTEARTVRIVITADRSKNNNNRR
jgi:hypothetical protein